MDTLKHTVWQLRWCKLKCVANFLINDLSNPVARFSDLKAFEQSGTFYCHTQNTKGL